ncbi:MAG: phosphate ABC transporter substrate-binding protein PstS [Chlorobi bacterium]|nr:phosphate ABC transporter substrate-binding protein PstS [Chlorobiota bacterium]
MKSIKIAIVVLMGLVFVSFGCSDRNGNSDKQKAVTINGAGATFPYPVYSQWAHEYKKITSIRLNYQSIGSGGGIMQIKAKTVDFGASDAPLKPEELSEAGLVQFPMVIGGVVPVLNLEGFEAGEIHLTAENLADIYLGKINKWNDAKMKMSNPGLNLPDKAIATVHRADGSGTTWIFTNYLYKVSDEWKSKVGFGKAISWPEANNIAGKGNEGVAAFVKKVDGSIGYVEYAYALQNKMNYVKLQNKAGVFVMPNAKSFQAAAANADWANADGYYLVLTDQPGKDSWPITGASFILMYRNQKDEVKAKEVLKLFDWCYKKGGELAKKLDYVPMPVKVVEMVEKKWSEEIKANGSPVWK